jgi:hypothetical protein
MGGKKKEKKKKKKKKSAIDYKNKGGDKLFKLNRKLTKSNQFVSKLKKGFSQMKSNLLKTDENQRNEESKEKELKDKKNYEKYVEFKKSKKKVIKKIKISTPKNIVNKKPLLTNFNKLEKVPIFKLKNSKNLFEKISSLLPILTFQKIKKEFLHLELESIIGVSNKGSEWSKRVNDFFFVIDKQCQIGKKKKFFYFVEKIVVIFYESLNLQHFYLDHKNKVRR